MIKSIYKRANYWAQKQSGIQTIQRKICFFEFCLCDLYRICRGIVPSIREIVPKVQNGGFLRTLYCSNWISTQPRKINTSDDSSNFGLSNYLGLIKIEEPFTVYGTRYHMVFFLARLIPVYDLVCVARVPTPIAGKKFVEHLVGNTPANMVPKVAL